MSEPGPFEEAGILRTHGTVLDLERLDRTIEALALDLEHPELLESWRRLRTRG